MIFYIWNTYSATSGSIDIQFFSFSIEVFCPSFPSFGFLSFFLLNVLKTYRRQIFLVSLLYDYALLLSTIILLIMLAVLNLRKKRFYKRWRAYHWIFAVGRSAENLQQIYRWTPMPRRNFNTVALQLYWNCTSALVFSCKFPAYFQNIFS